MIPRVLEATIERVENGYTLRINTKNPLGSYQTWGDGNSTWVVATDAVELSVLLQRFLEGNETNPHA